METSVMVCGHEEGMSGAQKCMALLVQGLIAAGYPVTATVAGVGAASSWYRQNSIPCDVAPLVWWVSPESDVRRQCSRFARGLSERVTRLVDRIEKRKIDIVISNTSVMIEPAIAAAIAGVPHIWHILEVVGKDPDLHPIFGLEMYKQLIGVLSDKVVGVSSVVAEEFLGAATPEKVAVVHTGIGTESTLGDASIKRRELGILDDEVLVTFAGVLNRRKGVVSLARAIPQVLQRNAKARFIFAGSDLGEGPEVRACLGDLVGRGRALLLGHRMDVLEILAASDIVVMPSLVDPLPVVVMEAMTLGKPVVATRSGGCEDLVKDPETGLLVNPDQPQELAAAILRFVEDDTARIRAGNAGLAKIRRDFSLKQNVEGFDRILRDLKEQAVLVERGMLAKLLMTIQIPVAQPLLKEACFRLEDYARGVVRSLRAGTVMQRNSA